MKQTIWAFLAALIIAVIIKTAGYKDDTIFIGSIMGFCYLKIYFKLQDMEKLK